MKRILPIFLLLTAGAVGCGGDDESAAAECDPSTVTSLTGTATSGSGTYGFSCGSSTCHGADGSGANSNPVAADLANVVPPLSDADIACIVKAGQGSMPAQSELSDQDVADVIAYLRQTFP